MGYKVKLSRLAISLSLVGFSLIGIESASANVVSYYADEHENRIIAVDIETMQQIGEVHVEGTLNHHADAGGDLAKLHKVYAVPKGSYFFSVVDMKTMEVTKKVPLSHKPRSGDAYNAKLGLILMTSANSPVGSLIDVNTDTVVAVVGEDILCENPLANETCTPTDFGGSQVTGHPYWLSDSVFAVVDRVNRTIWTYSVKKVGNEWQTTRQGGLNTKTAIHQIIPRPRTNLSGDEKNTFYAVEEGTPASFIPPSVLKLKFVNNKLKLVTRTPLTNTYSIAGISSQFNKSLADLLKNKDILSSSKIKSLMKYFAQIDNTVNRSHKYYDRQYNNILTENDGADITALVKAYAQGHGYYTKRGLAYKTYLLSYFVKSLKNQPDLVTLVNNYKSDITGLANGFLSANTMGGHNADFHPDGQHIYAGSAEGHTFVVNINTMKIDSVIATAPGTGHTTFINGSDIAIATNHRAKELTAINTKTHRRIKSIPLPFERENIENTLVSHTGYSSSDGKYYYNYFTDGGVFFRVNIDKLAVDSSLYTGGVPIQGTYFDTDNFSEGGGNNGGGNNGGGDTQLEGEYRIVAAHSGKCLTESKRKNAMQWSCNNSKSQRWNLKSTDTGYLLYSKKSDKVLHVKNSQTKNGANIKTRTLNGNNSQVWQLNSTSDDFYQINNIASNKCVDVEYGSYKNGANVSQYQCHDGYHQQWKLESVD